MKLPQLNEILRDARFQRIEPGDDPDEVMLRVVDRYDREHSICIEYIDGMNVIVRHEEYGVIPKGA